MRSTAAMHGPGRLHLLVRVVVAVVAILTAALLLSSTNHVDNAPATSSAVAIVDPGSDPQSAGEVVLEAALTGTLLGCALLALCCVLALALRIRWRRPTISVLSASTPYGSALAVARPSATLVDLHRLSISRT
ncbi:MAG: hypothetical protein ABL886_07485 [Rhodoglobus sp.]